MRLDKFLTECGLGSRREVKKLLDNGKIRVNDIIVKNPQANIKESIDKIEYDGNKLEYKEFRYYIMNKKGGYITATEDPKEKTVMELLPEWVIKKDLAPVGRLDKDTEGLLLFTNDGKLGHSLLSPKKHVDKTYYAKLEKEIGEVEIKKLEEGVYRETDNDLEAQMFEYIIDRATEAGYIHYEISNFCLPSKEARHNSKYWENREYLGIGLGASGYIGVKRYKNQVQFSKYYDNIERGILPILEEEIVTAETKEEYKYMLGFRLLNKGVIPSGKYLEKCISLEEQGFLKRSGEAYILTRKGIMLANDVLDEFI